MLFFSQTLVLLIILRIFLCKIVKICIISLGLWFQSSQWGNKSLGNISVLYFGERQSSLLWNVGGTWQPEHRCFLSVLLTTDKEYLERLTPGVFTEAWKKLELLKAIVSIFPSWQLIQLPQIPSRKCFNQLWLYMQTHYNFGFSSVYNKAKGVM